MSYKRISLDDFKDAFSTTIGKSDYRFSTSCVAQTCPIPSHSYAELSSVALGGQVVSVSDEFFAEAFHLLLVEV